MNLSGLLRDADPVRPGELEQAARRPEAAATLAAILADDAGAGARARSAVRRIQPRRRVMAVALATAIAVGAVAASLTHPGGDRANAATARLLGMTAAAAAREAAAELPPGHYWYSRTLEYGQRTATLVAGGRRFTVTYASVREQWVGADGSGRILDSVRDVVPASPADRRAWRAAGAPDLGRLIDAAIRPADTLYSTDTLPVADARSAFVNGHRIALSSDPDELERAIRDANEASDAGAGAESELFVIVGDLLATPGVPPSVRAALYRVVARVPDGSVVGRVTDPAGRSGTAIAFVRLGEELVIDPRTGELLARYESSSGHPSSFAYRGVFFTPRVVGARTERPGGARAALAPCVTRMERFADGSVRGVSGCER